MAHGRWPRAELGHAGGNRRVMEVALTITPAAAAWLATSARTIYE